MPSSETLILQGIIEIPQQQVKLLMEAGYLYLNMERYPEAVQIFEGVSSLLPQSEIPIIAIGDSFAAQQQNEKALKYYKIAIAKSPQNAFAHALVGGTLLNLGKKDEALRCIQKAVELDLQGGNGKEYALSLLEAVNMGLYDQK